MSDSPVGARYASPDAARILAAVQGRIAPAPPSLLYRAGLAVVALMMLLLPVIYIGLVALAGWGVVWYAVHGLDFFAGDNLDRSARRRGTAFLVGYLGPLAIGGILILFMIKPLFAPRPRDAGDRRLAPGEEPLLFDFVARICAAVGAPMPREICVDRDVNASASYRRGLLSLLAGGDLRLTVGLPLAAGMTLRQLSGVLAHEFGHFAQRAGLGLTYLIRTVNAWFSRVVYERDAWDQRLEDWSRDADVRLIIVLRAAKLLVWLSRRILWVLMLAGHALSCFLSRQMEFDADGYEARVAGSDVFEATSLRLADLAVADRMARNDLQAAWQEERLPDDLPALVAAHAGTMSDDLRARVRRGELEEKTGFFDTHPATRDRIAHARSLAAAGLFADGDAGELPASALFGDFRGLCRELTAAHFREALGETFRPELVRPVEELLARRGGEKEAEKALGRVLQGAFSPLRPLPLPDLPPAASGAGDDVVAAVARAREAVAAGAPAWREAFRKYDDADTGHVQASLAGALLSANLRVDAARFGLRKATAEEAAGARERTAGVQAELAAALAAFESAAADRLVRALRLLQDPGVAKEADPDGAVLREARTVLDAARLTGRTMEILLRLRLRRHEMGIQASMLEGNERNDALLGSLRSHMRLVRKELGVLHDALGDAPYPFEHARNGVTVREFAVPGVPDEDDLGGLLDASGAALDRLFGLHVRAHARLAQLAEAAEAAAGLPPLAEPPPLVRPARQK